MQKPPFSQKCQSVSSVHWNTFLSWYVFRYIIIQIWVFRWWWINFHVFTTCILFFPRCIIVILAPHIIVMSSKWALISLWRACRSILQVLIYPVILRLSILTTDSPSDLNMSASVPAMMQAMPLRTTALAKKELMFMGPWGLSAWLCGLVFVDRLNQEKARDTMNKTVNYIKDNNVSQLPFTLQDVLTK